jgi:valyl-tRNA synthetase
VATTRPETILGDSAVAVHPDDSLYRALVGRRVRIPFVERDVPVIADEAVERDFGTGALKITPAHDHDDYEIGRRHDLPMITILADDATINELGDGYAGLDRYEARKRVLADLEARGDLESAKPHEMLIGRCQRSNDVVEPRLKTQWFIRTGPLAAAALEATRSGRTTFVPVRFEKVWEHWMTNIHDWNVSRQLWWGHRIPAWYCPDGHVTVSAAAGGPDACDVCGRPPTELTQDPDIFDTWYSSGLWPFSTLGWPDDTPDLRRYYPTTVMETGYDIIFFWVARMMMLGIRVMGEEPFRTVYLHGLVKDPYGQRMSKTKGNVVDPLDAISESGADALRFALINGTSPGNDQKFSQERLENARNFANKLWNAARFVLGSRPASIAADAPRVAPDPAAIGPADRWLRSRIAATVEEVDQAMESLALSDAARLLYETTWNEFCDWGLEMAKVRLGDATLSEEQRVATWWTLVEALDALLRLLHPFMPFVTEAIWPAMPHSAQDPELLIVADWPDTEAWSAVRDPDAEASVDRLRALVSEVRNARSIARLPPGVNRPGDVLVPAELAATFDALAPAIERLARMKPLVRHATPATFAEAQRPGSLAVIAGDLEARIGSEPTDTDAGAAERSRLEREVAAAERLLASAQARLANDAFTSKAPPDVVAGARAREAELADQVARLRDQLGR